MAERLRGWPRALLVSVVTGVVLTSIQYAVRVLLGQSESDALINAGAAGVGIAIAIFVIAILARKPTGVFAIGPEVDKAIRTGEVPEEIDVEAWSGALRRSQATDRLMMWFGPVVFVVIAVVAGLWTPDADNAVAYRVFAVLFAAAAIATPFALRRELRKMEVVARELTSRRNG